MRCVAFARAPTARLAGLAALAVMTAALPCGAVFAEPQATAVPSSEMDYYTRRAMSVLEAERAALPQPHPLAAAYPGKEVVVCEAGCRQQSAPHVVHLHPRIPATMDESEGVMVPMSSGEGRALPLGEVACVAGCYGAAEPAVVHVAPEPEPAPALEPEPARAGSWPTSLAPRDSIDAKLSPVR